MMSMKKTVVAVAAVAVAQTSGVEAISCLEKCGCTEAVKPQPPQEQHQDETPESPKEESPKEEHLTKMDQCKKHVKECPEHTKQVYHKAKDAVKVQYTNAKSAFRGQVNKAVEKKDAAKKFAMENPKKCVFGSLATVGTCAAGYLKGNVALEFMTKHITACTLKLNEQLKIEATFDMMKATVTKCFTKTVKESETKSETFLKEIRAFFNKFVDESITKAHSAKDAAQKLGEKALTTFTEGSQKLEKIGIKNAKVQQAVAATGLAATGAVAFKGAKVAAPKVVAGGKFVRGQVAAGSKVVSEKAGEVAKKVNCPEVNCPKVNCPKVNCPKVNCPKVNCPKVNCECKNLKACPANTMSACKSATDSVVAGVKACPKHTMSAKDSVVAGVKACPKHTQQSCQQGVAACQACPENTKKGLKNAKKSVEEQARAIKEKLSKKQL